DRAVRADGGRGRGCRRRVAADPRPGRTAEQPLPSNARYCAETQSVGSPQLAQLACRSRTACPAVVQAASCLHRSSPGGTEEPARLLGRPKLARTVILCITRPTSAAEPRLASPAARRLPLVAACPWSASRSRVSFFKSGSYESPSLP